MTPQQKAAMRQALEALERYVKEDEVVEGMPGNEPWVETKRMGETSINALRQALEQKSGIKQVIELYDSPEQQQPADEPVAWGNFKEDGMLVGLSQHPEDQTNWTNRKPLYTRPQPAVAFTASQIERLYRNTAPAFRAESLAAFVRCVRTIEAAHGIEAKLREKNTGEIK